MVNGPDQKPQTSRWISSQSYESSSVVDSINITPATRHFFPKKIIDLLSLAYWPIIKEKYDLSRKLTNFNAYLRVHNHHGCEQYLHLNAIHKKVIFDRNFHYILTLLTKFYYILVCISKSAYPDQKPQTSRWISSQSYESSSIVASIRQ